MFEGFENGKITVEGIEISFTKGGNGPPVLLLHGYPQTKAMWAKVAPILAKNFTVICPDLRGYGDSSKPRSTSDSANYSFRSMADDQFGLMAALGYDTFHLAGHDRGARVSHRLTLDHPTAVKSLTLLDIVPTLPMFMETDRHISGAYWHWYFLAQPEPFPENVIGANPDYFFETCLTSMGTTPLSKFDPEQLDEYRKAWRNPDVIHGGCSDYRAAATIDLEHDKADLHKTVDCPCLIMFGANGAMAKLFDIPETWRERCTDLHKQPIEGSHFFVDERPTEVAEKLAGFLVGA